MQLYEKRGNRGTRRRNDNGRHAAARRCGNWNNISECTVCPGRYKCKKEVEGKVKNSMEHSMDSMGNSMDSMENSMKWVKDSMGLMDSIKNSMGSMEHSIHFLSFHSMIHFSIHFLSFHFLSFHFLSLHLIGSFPPPRFPRFSPPPPFPHCSDA